MAVVFRTTGAWGAGTGTNLTAAQVDNNFWELVQRIVDLETSGIQPNNIASIQLIGSQMTIFMEDGTAFGPFTLPISMFHWRGNFLPDTDYAELDIVFVPFVGAFIVLRAHHTGDEFDVALTVDVKATGNLVLSGNAIDGETATIGVRVYTFKNTLSAANQIKIGATASDTIDNLIAAIIHGPGEGTLYGTGTAVHALVGATPGIMDTMNIAALLGGSAGNSIVTTETMTKGAFNSAALTGGEDGAKVYHKLFGVSGEHPMNWRFEWASLTEYAQYDVFYVLTVGVFIVLVDHTSGTDFDPDAVDISLNPLYFLIVDWSGGGQSGGDIDFKESVALGTVANIALTGEQTIDGILTAASRILVKNQTIKSQNGIYVTAAGAWARSADADTDAEVQNGMAALIADGTVNAGRQYVLTTPDPIVVGTTALSFVRVRLPQKPRKVLERTGATVIPDRDFKNAIVRMNRATAQSLVFDGTDHCGVGTNFLLSQVGVGQVTVSVSGGVTMEVETGLDLALTRYRDYEFIKTGTGKWAMYGVPNSDGIANSSGVAGAAVSDALDSLATLIASGVATDYKESVRVATTANVTISTALNSGDVIDGVTLANGDRVLVKDQSTASQNGIYVAGVTPARAADFDTDAEVTAGSVIPVAEGTLGGNKMWILTTNDPIVVGTTALAFSAVGAGGGVSNFTDLGDVPASYSGQAKKHVRVNAAGTALEFVYAKAPIMVAASDETTAIVTGQKLEMRAPFAFKVTGVRASLTTAQTSGSIFTIDIKEAGTTILSTLITIDNTEKTTVTAVTPAVISDADIADDAIITVHVTQIGDGTAKGLKVSLFGYEDA